MAGSSFKLLLWSGVRRTEALIDRPPEPAFSTARELQPALRRVDLLESKLFACIATELETLHLNGKRGTVGALDFVHYINKHIQLPEKLQEESQYAYSK